MKYFVLAAASCLSLLLSLAALEGALRLGGKILTRLRQEETQPMSWDSGRNPKEVINILALGDSFTFGGLSQNRKSYPSQLAVILSRQHPGLTNITNNGVCEFTSRQVLNALPTAITLNRPDMILLLVGAANLFDPYPYADEIMPLYAQYDNFFRRLRIYKLLRYCYFEITEITERIKRNAAKARQPQYMAADIGFSSNERDRLFKLNAGQLGEQAAILEEKISKQTNPAIHDIWLLAEIQFLLKNRDKSLALLERIVDTASDAAEQDQLMREIVGYLVNFNPRPPRRQEDAVADLLLGVKVGFPEDHSDRHRMAGLVRMYSRNSELNPQTAIDAIDYLTTKRPRFYKNKELAAARLVFSNMKIWRDHIGAWFEHDMRNIIRLVSEDGSKIVLQTYPLPYEPINTIVRRLSEEMSLPLVDHEKIFAPLIAKHRSRYLRDDNHCTDLGHEIMAKHIALAINRTFLSSPDKIRLLQDHRNFMKSLPRQ
jgi:lysophospholipase L1-like esterase